MRDSPPETPREPVSETLHGETMIDNPQRRHVLRLIAACSGMTFAGCASDTPSTPTETASPSSAPTLAPSPSPSESTTSEPVGTGSNSTDLTIYNQTETSRSVEITVEQGDSPIYTNGVDVDSEGRKSLDIFPEDSSGTVSITARLSNGTEATYEWDLDEEPADGWVSLCIESDTSLEMSYAIA